MKKGKILVCTIIVAIIACIVGFIMYLRNSGSNLPDLPMLTISENPNQFTEVEMYMAFEPSELINANPWSESVEITTLSVYANLAVADENEQEEEEALTIEEMSSDTVKRFFAATYDEAELAAGQLQETYGEMMELKEPQVDIYGGDYNVYRERRFYIGLYEGRDSITDQIIHYHFNRVTFYSDEDEEITPVKTDALDRTEKVEDYPVISVKEAQKLLENGNYVTTSLYEMPGKDYIAKAELIYRMEAYEEYFMPYYCFYVEQPLLQANDGLKVYGTYYVPAVHKKYISNMPEWSERF